ncbi:purine-cytosine permease family protein [Streptomyces indicus]|uniref:Purine-cytosine permease n=1 Tax=Streptomyces indicus TaxID=417292 RepID=A0A1G9AZT2_9ACTN|nr:cytosine permease [Streptomyces indicus]SDK32708.1 Purine-cytosine permease [Streptomyces indicus]
MTREHHERAGQPEKRGIDLVADEERTGRPRQLFAVWAAPNVSYLSFAVGATLILMGLSLPQATGVILAGNLLWIVTGVVAASGPAAGTSGSVISRAFYGVIGNKLVLIVTGWLIASAYLALNWSAASVAGIGLTRQWGIPGSAAVDAVVICLIAAVTLLVAIYGYATIVRLYAALSVLLTLVFVVVTGYVLGAVDWSYAPEAPLHGTALAAALGAGFTLIGSTALSYSNSPDLARYLPRTSSLPAIAGWTAFGAYLPSVVFTSVGALAATTLDMADPQAALESVLPGWFIPVFVIAVVLNTVANNGMTAYSASLSIQSVGVRLARIPAVLVIGAIGTAMTLYAILVFDFLTSVNTMLQLVVALTGPAMAIAVTDLALRRNRYRGELLLRQERGGPYWYRGGLHWAGLLALLAGCLASVMWVGTTFWTGPLAMAMGGVDLAIPAGMGVAALVYWGVARALGSIPRAGDGGSASEGSPDDRPHHSTSHDSNGKGSNLCTPTSS